LRDKEKLNLPGGELTCDTFYIRTAIYDSFAASSMFFSLFIEKEAQFLIQVYRQLLVYA